MPWQQIISNTKDIASILSGAAAVAAFIAAFVAWKGLKSWRDQLTGRTEYELARRILRAVYQLRDAIQAVCNPAIFPSEFLQARDESGIQPDDSIPGTNAEDIQAVYNQRWKLITAAISDLGVESLEAEVLWGQEVVQHLKPLRHQCVSKLRMHLEHYISMRNDNPYQQPNLSAEEYQETHNIIYMTSNDPSKDAFTGEITQAVQSFENFIRSYLKITK